MEHPLGRLVDEVACSCRFVCRSNCLSLLLKAQPLVASACISALLSSLLPVPAADVLLCCPIFLPDQMLEMPSFGNDLLESFPLNAYPLRLTVLLCKHGLFCFERDSLIGSVVVCVGSKQPAGVRACSFGG